MSPGDRRLEIEIVVPLDNEQGVVAGFHVRLMQTVRSLRQEHDVTIRYVNDGSTDNTGAELDKLAAADPGVTIVELSRNLILATRRRSPRVWIWRAVMPW